MVAKVEVVDKRIVATWNGKELGRGINTYSLKRNWDPRVDFFEPDMPATHSVEQIISNLAGISFLNLEIGDSGYYVRIITDEDETNIACHRQRSKPHTEWNNNAWNINSNSLETNYSGVLVVKDMGGKDIAKVTHIDK